MTARSIEWITDSGLLVGLTVIGEFAGIPPLVALSLSSASFILTVPASGSILGATSGSTITAAGLPAGLTIDAQPGNAAPGWAYDGSGTVGSTTILLTETLSGSANSPLVTGITVAIAAASATLDFSQPANSGLIAALRSF